MPTAKHRTTLWIAPHVVKKIKFLGVEHNQPIGNVIEALTDFAGAARYVNDPEFQRRFEALLGMCFANAGQRLTWEGDPPEAGFDAGQGPRGDDLDA